MSLYLWIKLFSPLYIIFKGEIDMPTFDNTWLPFIYLYLVGGIFFLSGMIIVKRTKAINFERKINRFWWKVSIFGFLYFMTIHALLIIAALDF